MKFLLLIILLLAGCVGSGHWQTPQAKKKTLAKRPHSAVQAVKA
jgi:hypothetical protein